MLALDNNEITRTMSEVGKNVLDKFGKPKAILAVSAHWYIGGTFIQTDENPGQIYGMYGFPKELYEVKYPVKGSAELSARLLELLDGNISADNNWGIDHGVWAVLVHMFPGTEIPVVQLSVDSSLSEEEIYQLGKKLAQLREEGFLIFASGNIVHNLRKVEWNNDGGTQMAEDFNKYVINAVLRHEDEKVIHYRNIPDAAYAVPTDDHYLPLIYALGAADGDNATVFNNVCNLGSMAMTGFVFSE